MSRLIAFYDIFISEGLSQYKKLFTNDTRDATSGVYARRRIFRSVRSASSATNRVIINNPCENPHGCTRHR